MKLSLSERIERKRQLNRYLTELSLLVDRNVKEEDLESIETTKAMREKSKKFDSQNILSWELALPYHQSSLNHTYRQDEYN